MFWKIFQKAKQTATVIFAKVAGSFNKTEIIALLSMTLFSLTAFWMNQLVGDGHISVFTVLMPQLWPRIAGIYLWPGVISLIIAAILALSLRKIIGFLIAVPYFFTIGFHSVTIFMMFLDPFFAAFPISNIFTLNWFLLAIIPPLLVAALWNISKAKKIKIYQWALVIQLMLALGAVYYFTFFSPVQHSGNPVSIRQLRLGGAGALSRPLVEGDNAYLINSDGRLFKVALDTGEKKTIARTPLPSPAEVGFPDLYLPLRARYIVSNLVRGDISRVAPGELSYRYPYFLDIVFITPTYHGRGSYLSRTMNVSIHEETGYVSWRLKETLEPELVLSPEELQRQREYAGVRLVGDGIGAGIHVEGRGIQTAIDPAGRLTWTWAGSGWLLAGTDRGVLYIIDTGVR